MIDLISFHKSLIFPWKSQWKGNHLYSRIQRKICRRISFWENTITDFAWYGNWSSYTWKKTQRWSGCNDEKMRTAILRIWRSQES